MDPANLDFTLDPGAIRSICDRNRGVEGDGFSLTLKGHVSAVCEGSLSSSFVKTLRATS